MKLLIIDDIAFSLVMLTKELELLGHDVTAMDSPDDALTELKWQQDYDAVLCDYSMPTLNGVEFYNECLKQIGTLTNKRLPPFILFSATSAQAIEKAAYDTGFVDFIEKPFSKNKLEKLLLKTCQKEDIKRTRKPKILIYAETTQLQNQLEESVSKQACNVITISSPYEALSYYQNNADVSAVFSCESNMPVSALTFFELCKKNKRYGDKGEIEYPEFIYFIGYKSKPQETISLLQKAHAMDVKNIFECPIEARQIQQIIEIIGIKPEEHFEEEVSTERILLVENVTFTRLLVKKALTKVGYNVDEVATGREAIEKYRTSPHYKVVITSDSLSDMSSASLINVCRELQSTEVVQREITPFIALYNNPELNSEGFYASIKKPIDNAALLRAVENALNKKKPKLL